MEKITVNIKDGKSTVKVTGHAGPGCKSLTAAIEKSLGTTTEDKTTREYSERPVQEPTHVSKH